MKQKILAGVFLLAGLQAQDADKNMLSASAASASAASGGGKAVSDPVDDRLWDTMDMVTPSGDYFSVPLDGVKTVGEVKQAISKYLNDPKRLEQEGIKKDSRVDILPSQIKLPAASGKRLAQDNEPVSVLFTTSYGVRSNIGSYRNRMPLMLEVPKPQEFATPAPTTNPAAGARE